MTRDETAILGDNRQALCFQIAEMVRHCGATTKEFKGWKASAEADNRSGEVIIETPEATFVIRSKDILMEVNPIATTRPWRVVKDGWSGEYFCGPAGRYEEVGDRFPCRHADMDPSRYDEVVFIGTESEAKGHAAQLNNPR